MVKLIARHNLIDGALPDLSAGAITSASKSARMMKRRRPPGTGNPETSR